MSAKGNLLVAVVAGVVTLVMVSPTTLADVPRQISYQGRLTGNGDDPVNLRIRFYDAETGGNELFFEEHDAVPRPGGLFSINIGSQTTGGVPDSALDYTSQNPNSEGLWLDVRVWDGTQWVELTPRTRIVMVPYAAKAAVAEGLVIPQSFEAAVTVGSAGNIGIGTTSPGHALDVNGQTRTHGLLASGADGQPQVAITSDSSGAPGGRIRLYNGAGDNTLVLDGMSDGTGGNGRVVLRAGSAQGEKVVLDAEDNGFGSVTAERLRLYNGAGSNTVVIDGVSDGVGGNGRIVLRDGSSQSDRVVLDADDNGVGSVTTQILHITGGSDVAEPFDIANSREGNASIEPGMVVVIDPDNPGRLKLATEGYDQKVAGIISGANGLKPGMVMQAEQGLSLKHDAIRAGSASDRCAGDAGTGPALALGGRTTGEDSGPTQERPVALTGRVWCCCDASYGPIMPGDMLTTSATPGHAMKAIDRDQAFGSVIGKAMTPLKCGKGLVLVLVNLQ